jgi:site-specific DNA-methyltransferase (adenine-specific)
MSAPIIHVGDCLTSLRAMPDQSVQTCITSPPYFGLRDYGVDGQIGLEATPDAFVARLVEVFREVRRVLRDDGTLWLNLGDSYNSIGSVRAGKNDNQNGVGASKRMWREGAARADGSVRSDGMSRRNMDGTHAPGLKPKDLIGIPWRVAFALQADGWYLRQDIIWHKPNPMPESVTDRCTKAHEYVFLLSKSARYYFDADSIKEGAVNTKMPGRKIKQTTHYGEMNGGNAGLTSFIGKYHEEGLPKHRNRRSVWTVTTKPFKGAHFATFPPDLIEPCILAGCPVGGVVLDPFGGSGTTAGVALKNGRKAVLCELNPQYAAMIPTRIAAIAGETPDMFLENSNETR